MSPTAIVRAALAQTAKRYGSAVADHVDHGTVKLVVNAVLSQPVDKRRDEALRWAQCWASNQRGTAGAPLFWAFAVAAVLALREES